MVLGSGSNQRDAADVNLLNGLVHRDANLPNGLLERVEVADDKIDLLDSLFLQILLVRFHVPGEDTAVDGRVERLDAAAEHLRGMSDGGNVLHWEPGLADELRSTAGSQDTYVVLNEPLGQIQEACLVVNGDNGRFLVLRHA